MGKDFLSLCFPEVCVLCSAILVKQERQICIKCIFEMSRCDFDERNDKLLNKFAGKTSIENAWAYYNYIKKGRVQNLLKEIKYKENKKLGKIIGHWVGQALSENDCLQNIDLIIPVPLHQKKLKKRGYNQSDQLAEGIAIATSKEWNPFIMERSVHTSTQTSKSLMHRWLNVDDAFKVLDRTSVQNKNILLVDDVITTGATLTACANALLSEGAKNISVVAIASA